MSNAKFIDKTGQFMSSTSIVCDRVFNNAAIDIIRLSKMQVPHLTGALQSSGRFERKGLSKYEVSYNTPYARRWEYETPAGGFRKGRKSRYLRDPAEQITRLASMTALLRAELERIRL